MRHAQPIANRHSVSTDSRSSVRLERVRLVKSAGRELAPAARLLLRSIADYCGDNPSCWPSVRRLAAETGLSDRHIRRMLRELEASGWLIVSERRRPDGGRTSSLIAWKKTAATDAPPLTNCPSPPGHGGRSFETSSLENTGHVTCGSDKSLRIAERPADAPAANPAATVPAAASESIPSNPEHPQTAAEHPDLIAPAQPLRLAAILPQAIAARSLPETAASAAPPAPAPATPTKRTATPAIRGAGRWLRIDSESMHKPGELLAVYGAAVDAGMLRDSESMRLSFAASWCEALRRWRLGKVRNPAGTVRWLLDRPELLAVYPTAASEEKARSVLRRLVR